jgi:hypothetical protein
VAAAGGEAEAGEELVVLWLCESLFPLGGVETFSVVYRQQVRGKIIPVGARLVAKLGRRG